MIPIARLKTGHGEIVVLRNRSSVAYWQDDRHQSHADKNGVSLAGYIHAIHGLLQQARCRDVLMIGCGGGTLATMLRAGGVNVTIAEINEWSFEISRKYFNLPDDVQCHVADGWSYLQRCSRQFDAIVLDAYDGDDIPAQLRSPAFFELVSSRLREANGCFFANVIMRNDRDRRLDNLVLTMNATWPLVRELDAPGTNDRNAIAMAGCVQDLERPNLTIRPKTGSRDLARQLEALSFRAKPADVTQPRRPRAEDRPRHRPESLRVTPDAVPMVSDPLT
jgi:SAM-dependent methyltransferase